MQRLLNRDLVPPGDSIGRYFRYTHPETGHCSEAPTYYDWVERYRKHREANNLPIPPDFEAEMESQLCAQLPPGWCEHGREDNYVSTRVSLGDLVEAMKIFSKWALRGFKPVEQSEAERRADICTRCYLNTEVGGCLGCASALKVIGTLASLTTSVDGRLKVCANCKCLNRIQVHIPMELLAEKNDSVRESFPKEFCWQSPYSNSYINA